MKTCILIMRPDQPHESAEHDLPREPGYEKLLAIIEPILGQGRWMERVSVLADFKGGTDFKPTDMFVDENGHLTGLPFNRAATIIYRRNALMQRPGTDPSTLPHIVGTAILFDRRVWF